MIYFCHIPRTSGTSVLHAIHYSEFSRVLSIPSKPYLDEYDSYFNNKINKEKFELFLKFCYSNIDFLHGHFLSSPNIKPHSENLETFSFIRNPLERMISEFYYYNRNVSDSDWKNNKIHEIKNFLFSPNYQSQCLYLFGDYNWEKMKIIKNTVSLDWPKEKEISFQEILQIIKKRNIKLSTFDNRLYLLDELEISLNKIKKTNITLDKKIKLNVNSHLQKRQELSNIECFLSKKEIEIIKSLNNLDYQLYNYIKDHETKTGRCLTPDDILF